MSGQSNNIYAQCVLPPGTTTNRVLHLNPGDENDEVQGALRLLAFSIDPLPQYSCISYVWGDARFTKAAVINGQYVEIRKNLHDALRHVRSKTEMIVTWADALCINQSDIDEKSQQVAFMAEVYRRCSKVYIWLGLPEIGSLTGNPFGFLDHFVQANHFYDLPGFYHDQSTGHLTWTENEACDNMLNDFIQVTRSPWWIRAWTAQECLLPKDTVIMFGSWTTTWDYILQAIDMKNSHGNGLTNCCEEALKVFNAHQRFGIEEWMWHPGWVAKFRDVIHGKHASPSFYRTLLAFASRQCLNPRDKIYSMLSLATHSTYGDFKPNYREDISTVYTDMFTRMLQETSNDFISFIGGGFGSSMPGLPSWVPDFSHIRPAGVVASEDKRISFVTLYQASIALPFQVSWNEEKQLHYRGTYADTVKAVGLNLCTSNKDFGEVFRQWLDLCKEVMDTSEPTSIAMYFHA